MKVRVRFQTIQYHQWEMELEVERFTDIDRELDYHFTIDPARAEKISSTPHRVTDWMKATDLHIKK